jgi:hypothetical protein
VRENRQHGSEGGEAKAFPTPIRGRITRPWVASSQMLLAMTAWAPLVQSIRWRRLSEMILMIGHFRLDR